MISSKIKLKVGKLMEADRTRIPFFDIFCLWSHTTILNVNEDLR